jgi:hypothetical protein
LVQAPAEGGGQLCDPEREALQGPSGASQALSTEFGRLGVNKILRRLGLSKLIDREVRSSTPRTVQFPQALIDPAVVAADKQAALALLSYAKIARKQERLKF